MGRLQQSCLDPTGVLPPGEEESVQHRAVDEGREDESGLDGIHDGGVSDRIIDLRIPRWYHRQLRPPPHEGLCRFATLATTSLEGAVTMPVRRAAAALLVLVLVGCSRGGARTSATCQLAFSQAAERVARAVNPDKIDWLADLVHACGTLPDWTAAAGRYPQALLGGDPLRLLALGCAGSAPAPADEPLCRAWAAQQASPATSP